MRKVEFIDHEAVNQVSITQVAQDWGIELYPKGRYRYALYCPNPDHHDRHLGNCFITEDGEKNFFYCFACGAGGGPIKLVMYLEKCDYYTAKKKIAYRYGFIKTKYINPKDLPPRWEGLTYEEYARFGLKNCQIKIPVGIDENGETVYRYERFTLRDLAKEDPEAHDELLISKFFELLGGVAAFMAFLDSGKLPDIKMDEEWEKVCHQYVDELKQLLKKGLIDKSKFYKLFEQESKKTVACL